MDNIPLKHFENQSRLKKNCDGQKTPLDMVRKSFLPSYSTPYSCRPKEYGQTPPSEAPAVVQQEKSHSLQKAKERNETIYDFFEKRIDEYIIEHEKNYNSYASKLAAVQHDLKASCDQLAQFKAHKSERQAIFNESRQVLDDYLQLRNDPQRYQEELNNIDAKVAPLLEEFRDVQQKIVDLTKEQDKFREKAQKARKGIKRAIRSFTLRMYQIYLDSKTRFVRSKQYHPNHHLPHEREERIKDLTEKLCSLREQMQSASITPTTDKVFIQYEKYLPVYQGMTAMLHRLRHKELSRYKPRMTHGAQESETASLPEVAEIAQLFSNVQQTQRFVSLDSWCSPELRKKVETLVENIQQLYNEATATKRELNQWSNYLERFAETLGQSLKVSGNLVDKLINQIHPDVYSPYYSMKHAHFGQSIDIDSTLPASCGINTTRRGLSKLGRDIHSDATEKMIAQLVEYPSKPKTGGTRADKIQEAYRHYGFDYTSIDGDTNTEKVVTIEDIDRITKHGHVVNVRVKRPIGGHYLLIEGVTRTEDDCLVTFYDPNPHKLVTLPYKELEKVLTGDYTLPSEEQMKTREPILKR